MDSDNIVTPNIIYDFLLSLICQDISMMLYQNYFFCIDIMREVSLEIQISIKIIKI